MIVAKASAAIALDPPTTLSLRVPAGDRDTKTKASSQLLFPHLWYNACDDKEAGVEDGLLVDACRVKPGVRQLVLTMLETTEKQQSKLVGSNSCTSNIGREAHWF